MQWMAAHKFGHKTWLDIFPVEQELLGGGSDTDPEVPVLVDVGGGVGHQCVALVEKYPQLEGRVIFQDRPEVIANAIPKEGIRAMVHDFMTEQPIKGMSSVSVSICVL